MAVRKPAPGAYEAASLRSFVTVMEMAKSLGEYLAEASAAAIAERGKFTIAISGGSVLEVGSSVTHTAVLGFSCPSAHELRVPLSVFQFIKTGLYDVAETGSAIGMQNWHFFYVDERCVPFTSDDSNHNNAQILYQRPWCNTPEANIHTPDPSLPPVAMAADYEAKIKAAFGVTGIPSFDLIILGMGPDGHTASLFPGHPLLDESTKLVAAVLDSPKPPAQRITFTYPLINNAKAVAFVATGSSKAVAFGQIHHTVTPPDATLPCVRVKPVRECVWFVDADITRTMEDEIDRSSSAPFNPSSAGGAGGAK